MVNCEALVLFFKKPLDIVARGLNGISNHCQWSFRALSIMSRSVSSCLRRKRPVLLASACFSAFALVQNQFTNSSTFTAHHDPTHFFFYKIIEWRKKLNIKLGNKKLHAGRYQTIFLGSWGKVNIPSSSALSRLNKEKLIYRSD